MAERETFMTAASRQREECGETQEGEHVVRECKVAAEEESWS